MSGFRRSVLGELLYSMPPAIRWILCSCVVIWFAELAIVSAQWELGVELIYRWLALSRPFPWLWQLITYAFLHDPGGILHVGFNMFMLWMFGRELASRWGTAGFVQFYLTCAVGAALCHVGVMALLPDAVDEFGRVLPLPPVLGASGAIMGLFAAYGLIFPERVLLIMFVLPMKAKYAVLLFAFVELAFSFQMRPGGGIANLAHLGGMLTAWLYLKHAWRLARLRHFEWTKGKLAGLRGARRRRGRFHVVDAKEWDDWLEKELEDETRH